MFALKSLRFLTTSFRSRFGKKESIFTKPFERIFFRTEKETMYEEHVGNG
jgi:hypothetical protein